MTPLLLLGAALAAPPSDPQSWSLDPATTVVLVEDHRVPLVEVRLSFPAGTFSPWLNESHAKEAFELQMYDSQHALRQRADALAATFSPEVDDYSSDLVISCLKDDLPAVRQLTKDVLANKDYDPKELGRQAKGQIVSWAASMKDFDFVLDQAVRRLLYAPEDPRRQKAEKPEPISRDGAALALARDQLVALPGRVIGLAGDLSHAEAAAFSADLLPAAGTAPANLAPVFLPVTAQRPPEQVVHLPALTQTYFALAATDISWSDPDYAATLLSNFVLGGHFFSRLYVALRHEGGETYGARVTRDVGPAAGPLALTTFTRSENTDTTRDKLAGVLKAFHDAGVTSAELDEAKSALQGQRLLRREKPGDILGTWTWEHARGLPPGFKDASVQTASQLTLEQVNAFIQKAYDPATFTMVLLEAK